jgi:hypothetical protein
MAKAEPTLEERMRSDALRAVAVELRAIDDTIGYLDGLRSHKRSILRGALEAKGQRSSETIVRGVRLALSPFEIVVCTCHGQAAGACENALAGMATTFEVRLNGDYLSVSYDVAFPRQPVPQFETETAA